MLRSKFLYLIACIIAVPCTVRSCRRGPYTKLKRPLYEELKNNEVKMDYLCGVANTSSIVYNGTLVDMQGILKAEVEQCERGKLNGEIGKAVGRAMASGLKSALGAVFPFAKMFPVSLLALIQTRDCSNREFMETLVDTKISEYHLNLQEAQVRGWISSHSNILNNTYRFHQLLSLNIDMNNARYTFLPSDENLKMHSAVIARDYLNSRIALMLEIINETTNSESIVMYRRQSLELIYETVLYIKESVELARRYRYITSKDTSYFKDNICEKCKKRPPPEWVYRFTYDESTYEGLFQNQSCPIVQLEKASLPMTEWKKIADWFADYPGVCVPETFDCDIIQRELSFMFITSATCTARIQGSKGPKIFEFQQPCLDI